jgi:hypothetical protein
MSTRLCKALILGLFSLFLLAETQSVQAMESEEIPVHLKIDKYFVLYTQPSSPFIDAKHRLLIPLRAVQDLMGGTVTYEPATQTANLQFLNHTFEFTLNSTVAQVDGQPVSMDTTPVLKGGSMFLPIRLILGFTDINYKWDQKKQLLHITDERAAAGQPFQDFVGNDFTTEHIDGAFQLTSFTMYRNKLSITVHNISGESIPEGKSDIHPLVEFRNKGGFSTDSYSKPIYGAIPEVKKDAYITITQNCDVKNASYIIAVGRRKP